MMDFITKLQKNPSGVDIIWMIIERLTKSAYFVPIQESSSTEKLAEIYVKEGVSRKGLPILIISKQRHSLHFLVLEEVPC